jgi:Entner-Doudoroff aldolase
MTPLEFVRQLGKVKASAILRTHDSDAARKAMEAAIRGGFEVLEFTFSIPDVLELIQEFSRKDGIVVGAGTVLTSEQARQAVEAGARFLVSPVVDEAVIQAAQELDVAMMPGCATPTEMLKAHRLGAPLQKLFPGQAMGPVYVRQILGPLPCLRIVPTSGVTLENASDYLQAGSFAVGFVNSLFEPDDIASGRFELIEERARRMMGAVETARNEGLIRMGEA